MMKMHKKSDLTLVNGMLVTKDGDVVMPDMRVVMQANELETLLQKADYLAAQPSASPMPSLDGFKRQSVRDTGSAFTASTPVMDQKAEEAMAIMNELDDMETCEKANTLLRKFSDLLQFVRDDVVLDCGEGVPYCFDTPTIGSVLELTEQNVVDVVAMACGMVQDNDVDMGPRRIYASELDEDELDTLMGILTKHDPDAAEIVSIGESGDEE